MRLMGSSVSFGQLVPRKVLFLGTLAVLVLQLLGCLELVGVRRLPV